MKTKYNYRDFGRVLYIVSENGLDYRTDGERVPVDEGYDSLYVVDDRDGVPVCKYLNLGKINYRKSKKEKERKFEQRKSNTVKTVKIRDKIGTGDLQVKVKQIKKFLYDKGYKVRLHLLLNKRTFSGGVSLPLLSEDPDIRLIFESKSIDKYNLVYTYSVVKSKE